MSPLSPEQIKYIQFGKNPLFFIKETFGLVPQPIKPEYKDRMTLGILLRGKDWDNFCKSVKPHWFEQYRNGFHITWQQYLLFLTVHKALRGEVPRRISVVSGRGTGKSSGIAMLILWFLFSYESVITATGPTEKNLMTVLWPEISRWLQKMPLAMRDLYEWQSTSLRMKESPSTWFARAITASKESSESLSGAHHENQMLIADEASGIESNKIFDAAAGSLTNQNYLFIMISQGVRSTGYFYESQRGRMKEIWVNLAFNSEESPIVDREFVDSVLTTYGIDSQEYAIQVKGLFPEEGVVDDQGYVQLFNEKDLRFVPFDPNWKPVGRTVGALDASGEGQDKSVWAVRDRQRIGIVAQEQQSSPAGMAVKSVTICDKYDIDPIDFVIDAFGSGMNVAQEIALVTSQQKRPWRTTPINSGEPCDDEADREVYINKRSEGYYKLKIFFQRGGEVMESPRLKEELLSIKYKRTATGRIQIMPKVEMKKLGYNSPDQADAMSYCMLRPDGVKRSLWGETNTQEIKKEFDPFLSME
jgi:Helicase